MSNVYVSRSSHRRPRHYVGVRRILDPAPVPTRTRAPMWITLVVSAVIVAAVAFLTPAPGASTSAGTAASAVR